MVKRYCPKCNAVFNQKGHYDYHINRKYDCNPNSHHSNDLNDEKTNVCENLQEFAKICENQQINQKNNLNDVKIVKKNNLNDVFLKNPNYSNILKSDLSDLTETNDINLCHSINTNNTSFSCSYCSKCYSSKYTLSRHINDSCKNKKNSDNEKESIFKLLLEKDKQKDLEINELKKQNKILMEKIDKLISFKNDKKTSFNSSKIINNNHSNTINNTQNNFVMVNFGKEDLNIIDERLFIDRIIKKHLLSGVKIPDEVLKIIHFNPMYPQLSNIYISDINRDKCMVYEDNEWKLSNIDNIPLIIDKICLFSSDQINKLREKYPNNKALNDRLNIIEKYNNLIDNNYLEDLKDDEDNNDKVLIKRCEDFKKLTYNTLKKTLYNEGKKIKKNIKQI